MNDRASKGTVHKQMNVILNYLLMVAFNNAFTYVCVASLDVERVKE